MLSSSLFSSALSHSSASSHIFLRRAIKTNTLLRFYKKNYSRNITTSKRIFLTPRPFIPSIARSLSTNTAVAIESEESVKMGSQPVEDSLNELANQWSLETALSPLPKAPTGPNQSPIAFFHILQRLKTTRREGWKRHDITQGESIADHMYRMSIISMLCPDKSLNRDRCVKIALVHDMAESIVGDITPLDGVAKEEKHRREVLAMKYLTDKLIKPINPDVAQEMMDLWLEYENSATPEAIFVKDVDKFELVCQTVEYEHQTGKDLSEFLHVAEGIKNDYMKKWVEDTLKDRKQNRKPSPAN